MLEQQDSVDAGHGFSEAGSFNMQAQQDSLKA